MAKRPPHRMPYATHAWVGELLYQARNTLVPAHCVLAASFTRATLPPIGRAVTHLDHLRNKLDDALFAAHRGPWGSDRPLLRVYYPDSPFWFERATYNPCKAPHRRQYRRKWLLTWQDHLALAEWLWQSASMLSAAWKLLLPAYGPPSTPFFHSLGMAATALETVQYWCHHRCQTDSIQGRLQWPPDLDNALYIGGFRHFQPWTRRFAPPTMEIPA